MPAKKQLSEIKRAQIVVLSGEGYSQVEIVRKWNVQGRGFKQRLKGTRKQSLSKTEKDKVVKSLQLPGKTDLWKEHPL